LINYAKLRNFAKGTQCGSLFLSKEQGKQGLWHRFSSNEGGNLFDLIKQAAYLSDTRQAINWAKKWLGMDSHQATQAHIRLKPKINTNDNLQIFKTVPEHAASFNPKQDLYYKFKNQTYHLEAVYEYRNINNQLCGYVVRIINSKTGSKETIPVIYVEDSSKGTEGWRAKGFGDNRPLYNEQLLADNNKPVLLVEGEKTADHAAIAQILNYYSS
jgi:hypothetical protein